MGSLKLRVVAPCPEVSNASAGDAREWFCGRCALTVHNLSAMSEASARDLIARSEGRLCVRFRQRRDGTIISRSLARWIVRGACALGVAVLAIAFWACVMLVQRPWQALARRLAEVPPRTPPLKGEPAKYDEPDYMAMIRGSPALQALKDLSFVGRGIGSDYAGGAMSATDMGLFRTDLVQLQLPKKKRPRK